jgi:YHS domain-containing protein
MYKSQKIGFCCEDCIKEFKADPEKYVAQLKARKDGVK